jgi:hypothetical protein
MVYLTITRSSKILPNVIRIWVVIVQMNHAHIEELRQYIDKFKSFDILSGYGLILRSDYHQIIITPFGHPP